MAGTSVINNYETVVILNPNTTEEVQKDFFRKNKKIIEDHEGSLNHLDTWGSRHLANPIKKINRGIYFHSTFKANSSCVAELERTMRINDDVLRYFHTKLDSRLTLEKHLEITKSCMEESKKRFEEREAKFQARRAANNKKFRKPSR